VIRARARWRWRWVFVAGGRRQEAGGKKAETKTDERASCEVVGLSLELARAADEVEVCFFLDFSTLTPSSKTLTRYHRIWACDLTRWGAEHGQNAALS